MLYPLSLRYLVVFCGVLLIFNISPFEYPLRAKKITMILSEKKDSIEIGKVVSITDGDTFELLRSDLTTIKIRVANIDCPERKQPYSSKAKALISNLIFGKKVKVEVIKLDRYGRSIANVYFNDKNIGKELLRKGLAWHYAKYSTDSTLQLLENQARLQKIGLWSEKNAIPPWKWRKGVRE